MFSHRVLMERVGKNLAGDWASGEYLGHHICFPRDSPVLRNCRIGVRFDRFARFVKVLHEEEYIKRKIGIRQNKVVYFHQKRYKNSADQEIYKNKKCKNAKKPSLV